MELLLKASANPNGIDTGTPQSLLDWVDSDRYFEVQHELPTADALGKIVQLLKDYGAKTLAEILEENPGMVWKRG